MYIIVMLNLSNILYEFKQNYIHIDWVAKQPQSKFCTTGRIPECTYLRKILIYRNSGKRK